MPLQGFDRPVQRVERGAGQFRHAACVVRGRGVFQFRAHEAQVFQMQHPRAVFQAVRVPPQFGKSARVGGLFSEEGKAGADVGRFTEENTDEACEQRG